MAPLGMTFTIGRANSYNAAVERGLRSTHIAGSWSESFQNLKIIDWKRIIDKL